LETRRFQTVARVAEVVEGRGLSVEVDGLFIAVFFDGGAYFAIEDSCPHQGAPLSDGMVCDGAVTCLWHGWRIGLADGGWVDNPRIKVATYPVRVVGDEVQVAID